MEKLIPFEKLSKKERQKRNAARRGSWYGLNPVTRRPENSKAYNRRKAQKWSEDSVSVPFAMFKKGDLGCAGSAAWCARWGSPSKREELRLQ